MQFCCVIMLFFVCFLVSLSPCERWFSRYNILSCHQLPHHQSKVILCILCPPSIPSKDPQQSHQSYPIKHSVILYLPQEEILKKLIPPQKEHLDFIITCFTYWLTSLRCFGWFLFPGLHLLFDITTCGLVAIISLHVCMLTLWSNLYLFCKLVWVLFIHSIIRHIIYQKPTNISSWRFFFSHKVWMGGN